MNWEIEDRRLVIAAAAELNEYLDSAHLIWRLTNSSGVLTPGNILLGIYRLKNSGPAFSHSEYQEAELLITDIRSKRRAMWEKKVDLEIPFRIGLWQSSIEEMMDDGLIDHSFIAQVKNRVLIELLIDEIRIVQPDLKDKLEKVDQSLRRISKEGSFLWEQSLSALFPIQKFWFLYLQMGEVI